MTTTDPAAHPAASSPTHGSSAHHLAGRVAIVTGAGSREEGIGNGRAAAILLARAGARLALLDQVPAWAQARRR